MDTEMYGDAANADGPAAGAGLRADTEGIARPPPMQTPPMPAPAAPAPGFPVAAPASASERNVGLGGLDRTSDDADGQGGSGDESMRGLAEEEGEEEEEAAARTLDSIAAREIAQQVCCAGSAAPHSQYTNVSLTPTPLPGNVA